MIASMTSQGTVLVWHYPTPEGWGAFVGGFEEVDENIVYEEHEDDLILRVVTRSSAGSRLIVYLRRMKANWKGGRR